MITEFTTANNTFPAVETTVPARILFVSIYAELTAVVKNIAKELNLPIDILQGGIHKNGHLYAKEHQDRYDVIISQAGTAYSLQKLVNKPVISIPLTVRDYLEAFNKAKNYGKRLVLIGHKGDSQKDIEALFQTIFKGTAQSHLYECREDFDLILQKVMNLGDDHAIIGFGGCVEEYAKKYNIPYCLIRSSYEHIYESLLAGKNIIELHAKNKIRSRRLNSILNYSREGIIAVDGKAGITMCNLSAKRMLKLRGQSLIQMDMTAFDTPTSLRRLYGDGSFTLNQLMPLGEKKYLISRVPIHFRSQQQETIITFQELVYIQKVEAKARAQLSEKGLFAKYSFENIIAKSPDMQKSIAQAKKFSRTSASILIEGETGTGKELLAQSIHNASSVKHGPFVAINCAALPESLLESELFGYAEGAFTGAKKGGKLGMFELAHNGTIFLDEIAETSLHIQGRLLRVLQEKEIMRVGDDKIISVNTRIIAATNKKLYKMVLQDKFRNDLYFRLNLLSLSLPSLQMRKEDIPFLVEHFCHIFNEKYRQKTNQISPDVIQLLQEYTWPGNVRELENCIERSTILCNAPDEINRRIKESLLNSIKHHQLPNTTELKKNQLAITIDTMKSMQQQIIEQMLIQHNNNKTKVADELEISRVTVWKTVKQEK